MPVVGSKRHFSNIGLHSWQFPLDKTVNQTKETWLLHLAKWSDKFLFYYFLGWVCWTVFYSRDNIKATQVSRSSVPTLGWGWSVTLILLEWPIRHFLSLPRWNLESLLRYESHSVNLLQAKSDLEVNGGPKFVGLRDGFLKKLLAAKLKFEVGSAVACCWPEESKLSPWIPVILLLDSMPLWRLLCASFSKFPVCRLTSSSAAVARVGREGEVHQCWLECLFSNYKTAKELLVFPLPVAIFKHHWFVTHSAF